MRISDWSSDVCSSDLNSKLKPAGKKYLFIDEIQNVEGWEHFVNSHSQDFVEPYEIFVSGSNSKMLSGELATLLSGRYINFEVFPFSFAEYAGITSIGRASCREKVCQSL